MKNQMIFAPSMGCRWIEALSVILEDGNPILDATVRLRECLSLILYIKDPDRRDYVSEFWERGAAISKSAIPSQKRYDSRLRDYNGVKQIDEIRQRPRFKPESKSATAITLIPKEDKQVVPCLIAVDFKIRDHSLVTQAFFRSQDVWNKQPSKLTFLRDMALTLSLDLDCEIGPIVLYIASAHIYEQDIERATDLCARIRKKDLPAS